MLLHGYISSDGSFTGTSKFSNPVMQEAQKGDSIIVDDFDFVEDVDLYKSNGHTFNLIDGWESIKADRKTQSDIKDLVAKEDNLRSERNGLLTETDWTASSDVTMSTAMKVYRQALRNVPAQVGFPETITWPTKVLK